MDNDPLGLLSKKGGEADPLGLLSKAPEKGLPSTAGAFIDDTGEIIGTPTPIKEEDSDDALIPYAKHVGKVLYNMGKAAVDDPLRLLSGIPVGGAEALISGAEAMGRMSAHGLRGIASGIADKAEGKGFLPGFNEGMKASEEALGEQFVTPQTLFGEHAMNIMGLLPEGATALGKGAYNVTGSPAAGAITEGLANLAMLKGVGPKRGTIDPALIKDRAVSPIENAPGYDVHNIGKSRSLEEITGRASIPEVAVEVGKDLGKGIVETSEGQRDLSEGKLYSGPVSPIVDSFLDSITKLVGKKPSSLEGARYLLEDKLEKAIETRDTVTSSWVKEKMKEIDTLKEETTKIAEPLKEGEQGKLFSFPGQLVEKALDWKERERKKSGEVTTLGVKEIEKLQAEMGEDFVPGLERKPNVGKMAAEKPLVERFKQGDYAAFDELYSGEQTRLEKYARRFAGIDEATGKDLIADAMLSAWEHKESFHGKSTFSSWLHTMLINKYKNMMKKNQRHGEVELPEGDLEVMTKPMHEDMANPSNLLQQKQFGESLGRAMESLSDIDKQIINLIDSEEMTAKQAAETLGISLPAAKMRITVARERLQEAIKAEYQTTPKKVARDTSFYGGPGGKQRGAIGFESEKIKKQIGSKGIAQAVKDAKDQFDISPPKLDDVLKSNPNEFRPENIKDFDKGIDTAMLNSAIDKTVSILAAGKEGLGSIVKWAVDNRREIDRKAGVVIRDNLDSSVGASSAWGKMKRQGSQGHAQLQSLVKTAIDNIGTALDRSAFKTESEFKAYTELQNVYEQVRQDINTARSKFPGLKLISKLEGYVPAVWEGDYVVVVKDGKNQTKHIRTFDTRHNAIKMQQELQKKHPDLDVSWFEHGDSKFNLKDLSAFEETLRTLDKSDPTYLAVRATYLDILSKRSMGRHAAEKTGVTGFMGSEGGKKGVKNFEKAHEQYVKGAYNYIANLEKQALKEQLANLDPAVREKMPNGLSYMNEYLSMAKGSDISKETMIRGVSEWASSYMGFGKSGPQKAISQISSVASLFWLATPRFYLANMVQSLNSLPKMVEIAGRDGLAKNPVHAMFEGMVQTFKPDPLAKEAMTWAEKNGYMESSMVSMFNLNAADLHQTKLGMIGDIASWSQQKWEHHAVRTPSFLSFEYLLRGSVPDKGKRFQRAAELMDYYMVHYDKSSAPMMYEKAGMLGDIAKPLKQYAHNSWGQFFEFLGTAKDTGRYAPVATMLGVQASVAGLRGAILVAEATAIITALNAVFGQDIPTPEKALFSARNWMKGEVQDSGYATKKAVGGLADAMVYGGYSTALGVDISSSVNAPSLPALLSIPPAQFAYKAVKDSLNYIIHKSIGKATPAMEMQAWLSTTPSAARGFIEEVYTVPGQPIPRPTEEMKGNYIRTPTEQWIANLVSLKTIDEAAANDLVRVTKSLLASDLQQKMSAIDVIVGQVRENRQIDPAIIQKYVEEGGNVATLSQTIMKRMKEQALTYDERQMQGTMSPQKLHKLQEMKTLLDNKANKQ